MSLSMKALGALVFAMANEVSPTVRGLEKHLPDGHTAIRAALKELEVHGFIERKNTKINDRFVRESVVTEAGVAFLAGYGFQTLKKWGDATETVPLSQLSVLNNNIHIEAKLVKKYTRDASGAPESVLLGEDGMGYEFFEKTSSSEYDDHLAERKKAAEQKQRDYEAAKRQRHEKRVVLHRDNVDPINWTSSDIGYEFADRLSDKWNIKPWQLTQTRFIPALSEMRKRLGTDGQIDLLMLDMFFESVDFQKYDDPQLLWKMFIKRASELAPQAIRLVRTPDQLAEAQVAADKSWDWMED